MTVNYRIRHPLIRGMQPRWLNNYIVLLIKYLGRRGLATSHSPSDECPTPKELKTKPWTHYRSRERYKGAGRIDECPINSLR